MSESNAQTAPAQPRFPNRWALFPVGLLGILVTVQLVLFSMSRSDPSFAVEPEYYQKAVDWDKEMQQRTTNASLGWQASAEFIDSGTAARLRVSLTDKETAALVGAAVKVVAFPNARASLVQDLLLVEQQPGVYTSPIRLVYPGEWEVRITAVRDGNTFTQSTRISAPIGL